MYKKIALFSLIMSTPIYTMHDPCKDTKKYGVGAVISSITTYGLWDNCKKMQREDRHHYSPLSRPIRYRFGLIGLMGIVSYTAAVIATKECYNCYRLNKRQE